MKELTNLNNTRTQKMIIVQICRNMQCSNWHIINASNANHPILEVLKINVERVRNSSLKILSAVSARPRSQEQVFKIVHSMELTSLSLNANFVVLSPNGSAGATLISVNRATSGRWTVITCLKNLRMSFLSVEIQKRVPLRLSIRIMVKSTRLVVPFAEMKLPIKENSEQIYSLV